MKVLLISTFHPELVRGGAQQVCYELFQGLKAHKGIEAVLLAAVIAADDDGGLALVGHVGDPVARPDDRVGHGGRPSQEHRAAGCRAASGSR